MKYSLVTTFSMYISIWRSEKGLALVFLAALTQTEYQLKLPHYVKA